jgi:hypothetical protein
LRGLANPPASKVINHYRSIPLLSA